MNPKLHIDQNLLRILYIKYKAYLIPLGVITLCVVVFFGVVMPQFQSYLDNQDTVATDRQTIETLNQNIQTLAVLQEDTLTKDLVIVNAALPSEKDYSGIFNAISEAASLSNVSLGDYSFQVGDIFSKKTTAAASGQLPIDVTLSISGDLPAAQKFIDALSKEFPLSEVISLSTRGNGGSEIKATFFYNPLPNVPFNATAAIPKLSVQQQTLLDSLKKDYKRPQDLAVPQASASATQ